jgi:dTDP-4-dehydrorhamnose 3,5-epimerase
VNTSTLAIVGLTVIKPSVHADSRGSFFEVWNAQTLKSAGIDVTFVQENQSESGHGVLRGLHYQIRQPQGKLVRVIHGRIFDVAVDMRRSKTTFRQWASIELDAEEGSMLYVPPGFAHGFLVLSARAVVVYACTDFYAPAHERTLLWNDPGVAVQWPLADGQQPILSPKDAKGRLLRDAEVFR